jgi:Fe-S-cluster containining protein
MKCLHCGDCCLHFSPVSQPLPCPHLDIRDSFYFCGIYDKRPKQCVTHEYVTTFCPIGMQKLNIHDTSDLYKRIRKGELMLTLDITEEWAENMFLDKELTKNFL